MKRDRIIYWVATGLLGLFMVGSGIGYFLKTDEVQATFAQLGFPTYLVIPVGIAKILAIVAIVTNLNSTLRGLAYAGLFFEFLIALSAHLNAADNEYLGAVVALILLITSWYFGKKVIGPITL